MPEQELTDEEVADLDNAPLPQPKDVVITYYYNHITSLRCPSDALLVGLNALLHTQNRSWDGQRYEVLSGTPGMDSGEILLYCRTPHTRNEPQYMNFYVADSPTCPRTTHVFNKETGDATSGT